jgi:hypothetical protein
MNPEPHWDPLGYKRDLQSKEVFYPLGFTLEIETNAQDVLDAAAESWAGSEPAFAAPVLRLRVAVSPPRNGHAAPRPPACHAQGHLLSLVGDRDHFAVCDLDSGFAFAAVSEQAAADRRFLRFYYLECIAYVLLTWRRLTAIHASCVSLGERAALFCGRPGAGKSCLALACAFRGMEFVSDDAVYLLRQSNDRTLLGRPRFVRLKEAAAQLLPQLALPQPPLRGAAIDDGSEPVFELATAGIPGIATRERCRAAHVIFLERQPAGAAQLAEVPSSEALELLVRELPRFSAEVSREQVDSVKELVERGAYRLRYSDLEGAVEKVRMLLSGNA